MRCGSVLLIAHAGWFEGVCAESVNGGVMAGYWSL